MDALTRAAAFGRSPDGDILPGFVVGPDGTVYDGRGGGAARGGVQLYGAAAFAAPDADGWLATGIDGDDLGPVCTRERTVRVSPGRWLRVEYTALESRYDAAADRYHVRPLAQPAPHVPGTEDRPVSVSRCHAARPKGISRPGDDLPAWARGLRIMPPHGSHHGPDYAEAATPEEWVRRASARYADWWAEDRETAFLLAQPGARCEEHEDIAAALAAAVS